MNNRLLHQGIGGFNLADRGFNTNTVDTPSASATPRFLGATTVNEARLGVTSINVSGGPSQRCPRFLYLVLLRVARAGRSRSIQTTSNLEIGDNLSLVTGKHKLKVGMQILGRLSKQ